MNDIDGSYDAGFRPDDLGRLPATDQLKAAWFLTVSSSAPIVSSVEAGYIMHRAVVCLGELVCRPRDTTTYSSLARAAPPPTPRASF